MESEEFKREPERIFKPSSRRIKEPEIPSVEKIDEIITDSVLFREYVRVGENQYRYRIELAQAIYDLLTKNAEK